MKGLYREARQGIITNFTGISSPYEVPEKPEAVVDTSRHTIDECVDIVLEKLQDFLKTPEQ